MKSDHKKATQDASKWKYSEICSRANVASAYLELRELAKANLDAWDEIKARKICTDEEWVIAEQSDAALREVVG